MTIWCDGRRGIGLAFADVEVVGGCLVVWVLCVVVVVVVGVVDR